MNISQMIEQLIGGMGVSIQIFVVTLVFSLPLGLMVSFGRMSKNPIVRNLTKGYISIMRGTPLMLQLMVVYFGPFFCLALRLETAIGFGQYLLALSLIMPPILRRFIEAESSLCQPDNTKLHRF